MKTLIWIRTAIGSSVAISMLGLTACDANPESPISPTSAVLASSSGASSQPAAQGKPQDQDLQTMLAKIRSATARFQNIDVALASGYVDDGFGCIDAGSFGLAPAVGGMGFHLINQALHDDPETDPERPDLLVYEPAPRNLGKPRLVALEYEVFRPDWFGAGHTEPPTLFGREFESFDFDIYQIFGLHLWLWRDNPAGLFEDFNPKVSCR